MKKLLLLSALLIFACSYGQGEQLYADGTATDQDGNSFEWISYGSQDWAIENVEVVTYSDGTPIPQVTDATEWASLTTGAWCYFENNPSKGKLYNWYAVMGIHDEASLSDATLRKEFAPEGWHVPSGNEWIQLENYLIDNGYNYDGTTTENKIAKSMASTSGWNSSTISGAVGNDQTLNNRSGFNAFDTGNRIGNEFWNEGHNLIFWTTDDSSEGNSCELAWYCSLYANYNYLTQNRTCKRDGGYVRFVRDTSTASTENHQSNSIIAYPNPTSSTVTINGNKAFDIKVYDMTGRKIMTHTGNTIDMSNLSPATYIIKIVDNSNNEEFTYKVIKN